jgi:hypothetical protein
VKTDVQIKKLKSITLNLRQLLTKTDEAAEHQRDNMQRLWNLQQEPGRLDGDRVRIDFPDGDSRLSVTGSLGESNDLVGSLRDVGQVICKQIKNDEVESGWGSRHVKIYRLISAGALVEAFFGIAKIGSKQYAVMEDLRDHPHLATVIESDQLPDSLARLRLVYEVANTVAYLHSVGIIAKNISDTNIVLRRLEEGRRFEPCMINLEEARTVSGV